MIPREDIMPRFFLLRGTKCTIKVSNPLSALGLLFQLLYLRAELADLRFVIFTVLFQLLFFFRDGSFVAAQIRIVFFAVKAAHTDFLVGIFVKQSFGGGKQGVVFGCNHFEFLPCGSFEKFCSTVYMVLFILVGSEVDSRQIGYV